ncbi:MAG: hypothetical protein R3F43_32775 [bacterium]
MVRARREVGKALAVDEARAELRLVQAREGHAVARPASRASTRDRRRAGGPGAPEALAEPPAVASLLRTPPPASAWTWLPSAC